MPKRPPTKPVPVIDPFDVEGAELGSGRHTRCVPARQATVAVAQLAQRFDDHVQTNDQQLGTIREGVAEAREEIKEVNRHVGNLRVDMGKTSLIVDNIRVEMSEQQQMKHIEMIASVETGKAEKIANIEDKNDRKKAVRAFWLKVLIVVIGLLGTVAGMTIEHYR